MDSGTDWMDSVTCVVADEQCNTSHIAVVLWLQSRVYSSPYHARSSKAFQFIQASLSGKPHLSYGKSERLAAYSRPLGG